MIVKKRLSVANIWANIYLIFGIFIIILLLFAEYFTGLAQAYPGYNIEMFFNDPVHTRRYLTWSQIFFNFDEVLATMPQDIILSFFLAGIYLSILPPLDTKQERVLKLNIWNKISIPVTRRAALLFLLSLLLFIISLLGSLGLFGYQEKISLWRPVFFIGVDNYEFTLYVLPILLFFSSLSYMGYMFIVNIAGIKVNIRKKPLIFCGISILIFSIMFLYQPLYLDMLIQPRFLEVLVRFWLIVIFTNVHAIRFYVKRMKKTYQESLSEKMKWYQGGIRARWIILADLIFILFFIAIVVQVIIDELDIATDPALIFQSTINIIFTTILTIALVHEGDLIFNKEEIMISNSTNQELNIIQ
ncbi:MAG: hypothetical protein ACTSVI_08145 [Promethearchaeota archaeon]